MPIMTKSFCSRTSINGNNIQIPFGTSGHGGGDALLKDQIFLPNIDDPFQQCANTRDGALACLVGIAARNSIASGQPVKIADLTSIQPQEKKLYKRNLINIQRGCQPTLSPRQVWGQVGLALLFNPF